MADKPPATKDKKNIAVPLLIVVGLGLGGYGLYTALKGEGVEAGTIIGLVTDRVTGQPIPGVLVSDGTVTTTTGADGWYSLKGVEAGSHTMTFQKEGYETGTENVLLVSTSGTRIDKSLVPTSAPPLGLTATLEWS